MHRSVRLPVFISAGAVVLASLGAASPAAAVAWPVINEFSASTTGTDVEYIELLVAPGTDLSSHRILHIEGDAPTLGVVDSVLAPERRTHPGASCFRSRPTRWRTARSACSW